MVDIKSPINWVDSPEKATANYEAAAKVTQRRLAELGMKTHLEEIPPSVTRVRDGSRWCCGVEGCDYGYDANAKRRLGQDLGPGRRGAVSCRLASKSTEM